MAFNDAGDFDLLLPGRSEEVQGSTPGNVRIRITLPQHQAFHRIRERVLEASEAAGVPEGSLALYRLKRVLIGVPISSMQAQGERLSKFKALAVLSSDAISSVAYATVFSQLGAFYALHCPSQRVPFSREFQI